MSKRLLIDALHPEEIRVALTDETKLLDYEFESVEKKQIKSNIYLGKITRVEPSLQAAFVEYGGNRQGFLPFSEIHFDYYQIPTEDKEKLKAMIEGEFDEIADEEYEQNEQNKPAVEEFHPAENKAEEQPNEDGLYAGYNLAAKVAKRARILIHEPFSDADRKDLERAERLARDYAYDLYGESYFEEVEIESDEVDSNLPFEDEENENFKDPREFYKRYKIQEVIKRNQVVLVQVVKEERGSKGASLTTYLALAGRFSVFMPNTERGGGVSRRITNFAERKRIREILKKIEIEQGASVIVRTAGMEMGEDEIAADVNYLGSIWNNIRRQTLDSTAPALIYEESDIVRRSLRDMMKKDVSEVYIQGDEAYKAATKFMEVFSPEAKEKIFKYESKLPLYSKFRIEEKLDELYSSEIKLESGGSIVITPTEALVSIDVNSGKATKERSVEDTALTTNLEAAREVARQLRLRDLGGLVVIDFIDMRDIKNRKAVEKEMKDSCRNDRAKIQLSRISTFGLMEMSRQRLHSSIAESAYTSCPMCKGSGIIRSDESLLLKVIRSIEAEAGRKTIKQIFVKLSSSLYAQIAKEKQEVIKQIEEDFSVTVNLEESSSLLPNEYDVKSNKPNKSALKKGKKSKPIKEANLDSHNKGNLIDDDNEVNGNLIQQEGNKKHNKRKQSSAKKHKKPNNVSHFKDEKSSDNRLNNTQKEESTQNTKPYNDKPKETSSGNADSSSRLKGLWKKITS